jgi:hypothetical protein
VHERRAGMRFIVAQPYCLNGGGGLCPAGNHSGN